MFVRVHESVAVQDPDPKVEQLITLKAGARLAADDPIVKAYPWAFTSDVEDASATPGAKRSTRR